MWDGVPRSAWSVMKRSIPGPWVIQEPAGGPTVAKMRYAELKQAYDRLGQENILLRQELERVRTAAEPRSAHSVHACTSTIQPITPRATSQEVSHRRRPMAGQRLSPLQLGLGTTATFYAAKRWGIRRVYGH